MATVQNRVVWWALVVSQLIYVVVAHVAPLPGEGGAPPLIFAALATLAVGTGLGTLVFRRKALVRPIQQGVFDPSTPEGQQRCFLPYLLCLVFAESVSIYGLVLAFLSGDPSYAMGFTAGGLLLMWIHRPSATDLSPPVSLGGRPQPIG